MTTCVIMHNMIIEVSVMTASLTKGGITRVKTLSLVMERQRLHRSPNFIKKYMLGQLKFNFKMIWLTI